ncbi:hypothetical protein HRbin36_00275 [bacterium HR36]|nr:hypothetical protein HRbin36_00275 [bacterium HR36]
MNRIIGATLCPVIAATPSRKPFFTICPKSQALTACAGEQKPTFRQRYSVRPPRKSARSPSRNGSITPAFIPTPQWPSWPSCSPACKQCRRHGCFTTCVGWCRWWCWLASCIGLGVTTRFPHWLWLSSLARMCSSNVLSLALTPSPISRRWRRDCAGWHFAAIGAGANIRCCGWRRFCASWLSRRFTLCFSPCRCWLRLGGASPCGSPSYSA